MTTSSREAGSTPACSPGRAPLGRLLRSELRWVLHRPRTQVALGLLDDHTNVIHAVWVDEADLDTIAAAAATVVHNPVSNLRLGSGIAPLRPMLELPGTADD